jgi:hypothetical protein
MITKTYEISANGDSIKCLECGMTSWSRGDVENLYCGNCHEFHEFKELKARVREYFDGAAPADVVANVEEVLRMMAVSRVGRG